MSVIPYDELKKLPYLAQVSNRAVEGAAKTILFNPGQFSPIFSQVPQSLYDCAVPPLRFDSTGTLRETEVLRCVSMRTAI